MFLRHTTRCRHPRPARSTSDVHNTFWSSLSWQRLYRRPVTEVWLKLIGLVKCLECRTGQPSYTYVESCKGFIVLRFFLSCSCSELLAIIFYWTIILQPFFVCISCNKFKIPGDIFPALRYAVWAIPSFLPMLWCVYSECCRLFINILVWATKGKWSIIWCFPKPKILILEYTRHWWYSISTDN